MRLEKQDLGGSSFNFTYEADPEVVEEKIEVAVEQLKNITVPGFRPGKAPPTAIRTHKRKEINAWVKQELAVQAYDEILYETGIKVVGSPYFSEVKLDGKKFSCKMRVTERPAIELCNLSEIDIPPLEMPEQDLQKSLDIICLRHGELNPFGEEDSVEDGDKLTLNISYLVDEEKTDLEPQPYDVGSQGYPGLDEELIGMKAKESKTYSFDNGGKEYEFTFEIVMGLKNIPAALDDELAKKYGLSNVEELIDEVEKSQTAFNQKKLAMYQRNEIAQWLVDHHEFEVPEGLLEDEKVAVAERHGLDIKELGEEELESVDKEACNSVRLALILEAIRDEYPESVLSDNEAIQGLAQKAQEMGQDPKTSLAALEQRGFIKSSIQAVKDEFTLHWASTFKEKEEVENGSVSGELPEEVV